MEKDIKLEKEQERQRFLEFLGPKPDLTEIAEKTGIIRQSLYYITTGRNSVTGDIHREMAKAYPDYDLTYQMLGIRSGEGAGSTLPMSDDIILFRVQSENARLKIENEFLKRDREQVSQEKAKYWKMLETMHEQKSDFSTVSNQTTDTLFPNPIVKFVEPRFADFRQRGSKKPVVKWSIPGVPLDLAEAIRE